MIIIHIILIKPLRSHYSHCVSLARSLKHSFPFITLEANSLNVNCTISIPRHLSTSPTTTAESFRCRSVENWWGWLITRWGRKWHLEGSHLKLLLAINGRQLIVVHSLKWLIANDTLRKMSVCR
jgi:hypothetical protein